jgi:pimeloyl-ACP methyl ester carboxylesterase
MANHLETTEPREASGLRARLLADLPVRERRVRLNGIPTALLEGGEGPPFVLLHGPGAYGAEWLRVIPHLVTTHRVVAPDLPGHGATDPIHGPFDDDRVLGWLEDLIDCTCLTAPTIVGHLLGGAIGARFAGEHGNRVAALVLVDTLGLREFAPAPEFGLVLDAFLSDPTEATQERLWRLCAYDLDALRKRLGAQWERLRAYHLDRACARHLQGTQHSLMMKLGMPAMEPAVLSRVSVPTTLIWGRHDRATPLSVAQKVGAEYDWPLHVIEDAADVPLLEQPEAFVEALLGKRRP